mmetsp:Transcript_14996/g.29465  ORF Transcript_14996/g.29465 Transcript_14996/m.29465 type:complete len:953 (+) Transcript_14996:45-2903(+)
MSAVFEEKANTNTARFNRFSDFKESLNGILSATQQNLKPYERHRSLPNSPLKPRHAQQQQHHLHQQPAQMQQQQPFHPIHHISLPVDVVASIEDRLRNLEQLQERVKRTEQLEQMVYTLEQRTHQQQLDIEELTTSQQRLTAGVSSALASVEHATAEAQRAAADSSTVVESVLKASLTRYVDSRLSDLRVDELSAAMHNLERQTEELGRQNRLANSWYEEVKGQLSELASCNVPALVTKVSAHSQGLETQAAQLQDLTDFVNTKQFNLSQQQQQHETTVHHKLLDYEAGLSKHIQDQVARQKKSKHKVQELLQTYQDFAQTQWDTRIGECVFQVKDLKRVTANSSDKVGRLEQRLCMLEQAEAFNSSSSSSSSVVDAGSAEIQELRERSKVQERRLSNLLNHTSTRTGSLAVDTLREELKQHCAQLVSNSTSSSQRLWKQNTQHLQSTQERLGELEAKFRSLSGHHKCPAADDLAVLVESLSGQVTELAQDTARQFSSVSEQVLSSSQQQSSKLANLADEHSSRLDREREAVRRELTQVEKEVIEREKSRDSVRQQEFEAELASFKAHMMKLFSLEQEELSLLRKEVTRGVKREEAANMSTDYTTAAADRQQLQAEMDELRTSVRENAAKVASTTVDVLGVQNESNNNSGSLDRLWVYVREMEGTGQAWDIKLSEQLLKMQNDVHRHLQSQRAEEEDRLHELRLLQQNMVKPADLSQLEEAVANKLHEVAEELTRVEQSVADRSRADQTSRTLAEQRKEEEAKIAEIRRDEQLAQQRQALEARLLTHLDSFMSTVTANAVQQGQEEDERFAQAKEEVQQQLLLAAQQLFQEHRQQLSQELSQKLLTGGGEKPGQLENEKQLLKKMEGMVNELRSSLVEQLGRYKHSSELAILKQEERESALLSAVEAEQRRKEERVVQAVSHQIKLTRVELQQVVAGHESRLALLESFNGTK